MRVLFALILISTTALCQSQDIDTLKNLPVGEVEKLREIKRQQAELKAIEVAIIESAFNHRGIPIPQKTEFNGKDILYIKDEKK